MNNPRFDECVDPLHGYRWDPHIRMALRSIQILTYRGDSDLWASHFPFIHRLWDLLLSQPYTVSIDFAPGYTSPYWPTPSWRWANHGTWEGGRGCLWVSRRLTLWLGLLYLVRLDLRLGTSKLLGITRVSLVHSLLRIQVDPCYFFRDCCPRWGWHVVIYTVSYYTGDVWEDITGMTKEGKRLELDQKFSHCINSSMYYCTRWSMYHCLWIVLQGGLICFYSSAMHLNLWCLCDFTLISFRVTLTRCPGQLVLDVVQKGH